MAGDHDVLLVLAHASDAGAASVAASVRSLLSGWPIEVWTVRPESLGLAQWSHTVDAQGSARTRLLLPGRPALHSGQIRAVFNRIQHLPVPQFSQAPPKDRDYAALELQALVLSWLAACGNCVVQPLRSQPWLVPQLPRLHWASAAARCGLPVASWRFGGGEDGTDGGKPGWDATVLVAGTQTTGVLAGRLGVACVATAQNLGFTLLEFRFSRRAEGNVLVDVCPHPALSDLEDIDAVAHCLAGLAHLAHLPEWTDQAERAQVDLPA